MDSDSESNASAEQAFILGESALGAALQALDTAEVAESETAEAARLARVAHDAAQLAYDYAEKARHQRYS